ncbi:30S ribosomal protein S12 methylthiotransferase RimO [Bengtsoniella intestinalis]|uniref:30S ribosomal protein S12 methylthiotransferase RimO n=1 Tax=Bengtsoniella intestinalis TaxID=3073143 RepID=UPI00391F32B2
MNYNVSFISLGCAKNQVNCEQMMARTRDAGHTLMPTPYGSDVVVVNTCGFIDSAKEEAIANVLEMGKLKLEGQVKKILVTGCMAQRYKDEIMEALPEVDGILGTGNYADIARAVDEVMHQGKPTWFSSIHAPEDEYDRVLTTPSWYAYLRIAEGCDNHCAFCVIPSLRGKYRSRPMDNVVAEAQKLSDSGVKECIVVAQDITRYGMDWDGKRHLADLLKELCKMDFHWIRLHYLYPDEITPELIEVMAQEEKILPYLDLPIQHCNDTVLTAMNRRGNKAYLLDLFPKLKEALPGLVVRTSLITGLPGEDEEAFEELCDFLREVNLQRVGVFPFSPQEGTPAEKMERVEFEEAVRRADLLVDVQSRIMDDYNESALGEEREILCEGFDSQTQMYFGRSYAESPDIDGRVHFEAEGEVEPGTFVMVQITDTMDGELTGKMV